VWEPRPRGDAVLNQQPYRAEAALPQVWPSLATTENLGVWEPRPRGDAVLNQQPYRAEAALPQVWPLLATTENL